MNTIANKKGFTLIEILIVIFIVALLSVLAIGGYLEYRKLTLLNYSADSVVAQILELRDEVIYGTENEVKEENSAEIDVANGENEPKVVSRCTGILFGADGAITRLSVPYNSKKKWDNFKNDWVQGECEIDDSDAFEKEAFELDQNVELGGAAFTTNTKYLVNEDTVLLFVPYDGNISVKKISLLVSSAESNDNPKIIEFEIKYTNSEDSKFKRIIKIDPKSGKVNWDYYYE